MLNQYSACHQGISQEMVTRVRVMGTKVHDVFDADEPGSSPVSMIWVGGAIRSTPSHDLLDSGGSFVMAEPCS